MASLANLKQDGTVVAGLAIAKGTYTFGEGTYRESIYTGELSNGKPYGKGKFTCANGDVYEGEYKDDVPNVKGKFTYANGAVYEGAWKNGKRHGKGGGTYTDGRVEEGDWKDNKFIG